MAERTIHTEVILDGNKEFVSGMDEMTAAMRRATEAAEELEQALTKLSRFQAPVQTSSSSAPQ